MKLLITDLDNVFFTDSGLYDDAMEFLRGAHERLFTVILTNHPLKNTKERIEGQGISEYIDLVISATEYEMPKPDPRIVNVLLALLNNEGKKFEKSDIVFVGERPSLDIKFGNKAGIHTIRMRRGRYSGEEPEYPEEVAKVEVKNLAELASVLGTEMKKEIVEPAKGDLSNDFDSGPEMPAPEATEGIAVSHPVKRRARKKRGAKRTARLKKRVGTPAKKRSIFGFEIN